ncbi:MAG: hypothetical protein V7638_3830 [Acidobacteriota bacterium]|jgi:hypothetical protein
MSKISNEESLNAARFEEMLAKQPGDCAILRSALLEYLRASRRAKLSEVAALERFERALTNQRASRASEG